MTTIDDIDRHVGQRVKIRRIQLGMSQASVAEKMGVSFQSVQKFETATNRISAARLYKISRILDVPIHYFFAGYDQNNIAIENDEDNLLLKAESADVLNVYFALKSDGMRHAMVDFIRNMAAAN